MKEFRELSLQGNRAQLEDALTEIEKRLKDGWTRDRDQENRISSVTPSEIYCELAEYPNWNEGDKLSELEKCYWRLKDGVNNFVFNLRDEVIKAI